MAEGMEKEEQQRLDILENHAVKTEGRVGVIEQTLGVHGEKLDQIVTAVTRYDARPVFDFHTWVKTIGVLIGMGSVFGGLAVWLVLTLTAADARVTEVKLHYAEIRLQETRDLLRELANVTTVRKSANGN